jgi:folylpolyglutamate synthase/dihydropteroate synthase
VRECFREITTEDIINGLKKVVHPFRFEFFKDKNLIVDVCHNPNGVEALRYNLDTMFPEPKRIIFGALNNKDYSKMINILCSPEDEILFYGFDYPSAATYEELSSVCPYPNKPFDGVSNLDDKLTVICGSFYMLNKIKGLKEATNPHP